MGRILDYILERTCCGRRAHFTLIDPDETDAESAARIARIAAGAGSDAILVGGSIGVSEPRLSNVVRAAKKASGLPVILFPGNINGLTPEADAVLFMSMLNSSDPYYISGAQMQAAPLIARMGLEPIPTAYIIVGHGGAAGYVGYARPIPYGNPEIVAAYTLSAAMMGMKLVYLEAGSGAPRPVPPRAVELSRKLVSTARLDAPPVLVVGGGVRDPETASALASAGAQVLVTGTLVEEEPDRLPDIVRAFKEGRGTLGSP